MALAYLLRAVSLDPVWALLAVVGPILIVSFGALTSIRSPSWASGEARSPWTAPLLIGAVVMVSALGPATLVQRRTTDQIESFVAIRSSVQETSELVLSTARTDGPAAALSLLRQRIERHPELALHGHHLAHETGRISVEQTGFDLGVFDQCTLEFASGCLHGVLERYFYSKPDISSDEVARFCLDLTGDADLGVRALECSHGLGHGLAVRWDHSFGPAAGYCDVLLTEMERRECRDGVFMEVAVHALGGGHQGAGGDPPAGRLTASEETTEASHSHAMEMGSRGPEPSDPTQSCSLVADAHLLSCWAYQHMVIRVLSNLSWEETYWGCQNASSPEFVAECVFGLGKQVGTEGGSDWRAVVQTCDRLPREGGPPCIAGAVEAVVDQSWSSEEAFAFCALASAALEEGCYHRLGFRLGFLHSEAQASTLCDRSETQRARACRAGVRQSHSMRFSGT